MQGQGFSRDLWSAKRPRHLDPSYPEASNNPGFTITSSSQKSPQTGGFGVGGQAARSLSLPSARLAPSSPLAAPRVPRPAGSPQPAGRAASTIKSTRFPLFPLPRRLFQRSAGWGSGTCQGNQRAGNQFPNCRMSAAPHATSALLPSHGGGAASPCPPGQPLAHPTA